MTLGKEQNTCNLGLIELATYSELNAVFLAPHSPTSRAEYLQPAFADWTCAASCGQIFQLRRTRISSPRLDGVLVHVRS